MPKNELLPHPAVITSIHKESPDIKTFTLNFVNESQQKHFTYTPGQFMEISIMGAGEAPISITSSPTQQGILELCIRQVGTLTTLLHQLQPGSKVGIRGPYGNGFPLEELKGYNLLFIAGGIGLAPLRSLINYVLYHRQDYGTIHILYGAKAPGELIFYRELICWNGRQSTNVLTTVDQGSYTWKGNVGLVTSLLDTLRDIDRNFKAIVCGPPVMIPFVVNELLKLGLPDEHIISTLENHMKCGIGKCGHCLTCGKYICTDGPVFSYKEMKSMGY
ncbi:FAD/NAD(P)-binding protein [Metallumcola ferriviriculae]|uniref:FAD/NAD(P)-binding protein n=1 Tax=Metallumcola ferriviriculae TaxID=3039180 RepID=A0AAU0UK34_9FIRM|nr:FAD/NAD(P)-binding protein [Desulfitibacteraceae bacterium MK1]